jgi:hypothetical protein
VPGAGPFDRGERIGAAHIGHQRKGVIGSQGGRPDPLKLLCRDQFYFKHYVFCS